jgi:hypothetical protein
MLLDTIVMMSVQEALDIAEHCAKWANPPTNPVVLMRAALSIYKHQGNCDAYREVIRWLGVVSQE